MKLWNIQMELFQMILFNLQDKLDKFLNDQSRGIQDEVYKGLDPGQVVELHTWATKRIKEKLQYREDIRRLEMICGLQKWGKVSYYISRVEDKDTYTSTTNTSITLGGDF